MQSKSVLSILILALTLPMTGHARKMAYRPTQMPDELVKFGSCSELERHVDRLLTAQQNMWREDRGAGFGGALFKGEAKMRQAAAPPAAEALASMDMMNEASVEQESSGPSKVVGTNNQVEKVDEADFVKFNGKYIYQLHNGTLRILKAWPASELNQISSINVNGQAQEMLINDRNAVIMTSDHQNLTAVVLDISNPRQPRQLTEFQIPGHYKTARLIGDTLRIVNQDYGSIHSYWQVQPMVSGGNSWFQEETVQRKLNIRPTVQNVAGNSRTLDVVKDCRNVLVPKSVAPNLLTRIITIDLKGKKYEETLAFVQPDTVYASEKAIYLAHSGWGEKNGMGLQQTAIHKFALESGRAAEYQASGLVDGHLINQFAMDEHKSYLRIATTGNENTNATWFGRGSNWQQVSRIQVLAQKDKSMKIVGKSGDMGKGERLYSARFNGDKGFVVTFRQVDPLYTIDLRNPYRPRVMGELKVPGFSTYIHMLDDRHLLTVGQDADETTGRVRGLKLSVFDVRNFSKPKEVKSLIFKSDVSSESSYEHKAFTFYREKGVLAIPASQNHQSSQSLLLFSVTTTDIKASGELVMTDLAGVRRSFFADNIVYAIGGNGVRASALDNTKNPLATVNFDSGLAETGW